MSQCMFPIHLRKPQKLLNGEIVNAVVPCGHCPVCLENKAKEWTFRLKVQLKHSTSAYFVGLSYSDENLSYAPNGEMTLVKKDFQDFMKRLRSYLPSVTGISGIKYYGVGEYSPEEHRPHFHICLFDMPLGVDTWVLLRKAWNKGFITCETVTPGRIGYTCMYSLASHILDNRFIELDNKVREYFARNPNSTKERASFYKDYPVRPFNVMSKGIGASYLKTHEDFHRSDLERFYAVDPDGYKINLPRYYRERLYNPDERMLYQQKCLEKASKFDRMSDYEKNNYREQISYMITNRVRRSKYHLNK